MVSMPAFYSDNPSSNTAEVYNFSVKLYLKRTKNKQKEAGFGPFLNICRWQVQKTLKILEHFRVSQKWQTSSKAFVPLLFITVKNSSLSLTIFFLLMLKYVSKM